MIVFLNKESVEVPDESVLADLIDIADKKLHYGDSGMCVLNGVLCVEYGMHIKENDRIDVIPALEGG